MVRGHGQRSNVGGAPARRSAPRHTDDNADAARSALGGLRPVPAARARLYAVRLADRTGLSTPFLSQVENGVGTPSLTSLFALCPGAQTTAEALLAGPPIEPVVVIRAAEGACYPVSDQEPAPNAARSPVPANRSAPLSTSSNQAPTSADSRRRPAATCSMSSPAGSRSTCAALAGDVPRPPRRRHDLLRHRRRASVAGVGRSRHALSPRRRDCTLIEPFRRTFTRPKHCRPKRRTLSD